VITVQIESQAVDNALAAISRKIAHKRDMLDDIGAAVAESVRYTFIASASPYGRKWAPVTSRTLKSRSKSRSIEPLRDTGRLMNSITHRATGSEVTVGTNVIYAAIHNFGGQIEHAARSLKVRLRKTKDGRTQFAKDSHKRARTVWGEAKAWTVRIPARPFLPNQASGLPSQWEDQVIGIVSRFIQAPKA
jgi:phage virion morphogenesis protein